MSQRDSSTSPLSSPDEQYLDLASFKLLCSRHTSLSSITLPVRDSGRSTPSSPTSTASTMSDSEPVPIYPITTQRVPWTKEEDLILARLVSQEVKRGVPKGIDWKRLSQYIPGRSAEKCRKRWRLRRGSQNKHLNHGAWSSDEDLRLIAFMNSPDKPNKNVWAAAARVVGTRKSDQCSKRWKDALDPAISHSPWTAEEDVKLDKACSIHGTAWSEIKTKYFSGRSNLELKNRWDHLSRRKKREQRMVGKVPKRPYSKAPKRPRMPAMSLYTSEPARTTAPYTAPSPSYSAGSGGTFSTSGLGSSQSNGQSLTGPSTPSDTHAAVTSSATNSPSGPGFVQQHKAMTWPAPQATRSAHTYANAPDFEMRELTDGQAWAPFPTASSGPVALDYYPRWAATQRHANDEEAKAHVQGDARRAHMDFDVDAYVAQQGSPCFNPMLPNRYTSSSRPERGADLWRHLLPHSGYFDDFPVFTRMGKQAAAVVKTEPDLEPEITAAAASPGNSTWPSASAQTSAGLDHANGNSSWMELETLPDLPAQVPNAWPVERPSTAPQQQQPNWWAGTNQPASQSHSAGPVMNAPRFSNSKHAEEVRAATEEWSDGMFLLPAAAASLDHEHHAMKRSHAGISHSHWASA